MLSRRRLPPALEQVIERFEARARAGRALVIERVAADLEPLSILDRTNLFAELIAIDLEFRWQSPHRRGPLLEHYAKRLRLWETLDHVPLELITEEYRARQRFGDRPAHAEYMARFPRHGASLSNALAEVDAELSQEYPAAVHSARAAMPGHTAFTAAGSLVDYRDYAIRRLIAAGGMSRVYTAVQKSTQQPVALKVLNKQLLRHPLSVARFEREARIAAALDIPRVAKAHGLGRFPDGGYFLVQQLVDGPDLTRLAGQPLDDHRAVELLSAITTLVAQLHHAGWIHCDVKPSNILIDTRVELWLIDLAMAQPWPPSNDNSEEGHFAVGGTPAFMAPEQRAGDAKLLSPATDIYALGGVLHFLLTTKAPAGGGASLLDQVETHYAQVVRRCLSAQPADRYQSCGDLLAALATKP